MYPAALKGRAFGGGNARLDLLYYGTERDSVGCPGNETRGIFMLLRINRESGVYRAARWVRAPFRDSVQCVRRVIAERGARRTIQAYLDQRGFKGLQVGCGPFACAGWLNSDLLDNPGRDLFVDITRPLEFPDGSLDVIYAAEVIEHVKEESALKFFAEAHRVLNGRGTLRLTTPDLAEICRLYLGEHPGASIEQFGKVWKGGAYTAERWTNAQFRAHGHQFIWSFEYLTKALRAAGFGEVRRCQARQTGTRWPQLGSLERHYGEGEPAWVFARTIVLEASKEGSGGGEGDG